MEKKRILIAPNSFKGCADSLTIANLIESHLRPMQKFELVVKPISDGGDGFLKVCQFYFGGTLRYYQISTAYDNSLFNCPVLYCEDRQEIYIESAEVLGTKRVPEQFRKPLELTSRGIGEIIRKLQEEAGKGIISIRKVFIGIGGTATVDMGIGMMSELGLELLDSENKALTVLPKFFILSEKLSISELKLSFEIEFIADVENELLGSKGGIKIYSRQKGATNNEIQNIENSFNHLINLFEKSGLPKTSQSLSGAGGGLPVVSQIIFGSRVLSSNQFIMENLGMNMYYMSLNYIVTGEGAFDYQSTFGKGVNVLIEGFKSKVDKIFLICGIIDRTGIMSLPKTVYPIELSGYFNSTADSIQNYKLGLEMACREILAQI